MSDKAARPVYWHQGLFLQPQHFQLADRFNASLLRPLLQHGQPHFWGVAAMQIQEAGLGNKWFEIDQGEFIFPDGTCVSYPDNAVLQPRSFEADWLQGDKPFQVYLGLRKWSPAQSNVTVAGDDGLLAAANTRFVTPARPESIDDLYSEGPAGRVQQLRYVLRIFFETELKHADPYVVIPVARLERAGDDVRLARHYVPPCVGVGASAWLVKVLKDIRDSVASRGRQLVEYKDPKEFQTPLLALYALNRHIPLLTQLCESGQIHPWAVYSELRQLVGELSTFSIGVFATGERPDGSQALPAYDHQDLGTCFKTAQALIGRLLDAILTGPEHLIRLQYDGTYHTGTIPQEVFARENKYWLLLQTSAQTQAVLEGIEHLAKLGTPDSLPALVARAIPGIGLRHHPQTPAGLPQRPDTHYFEIDTAHRLWSDVVRSGSLSLYWDPPPPDLAAEIIITED